MTFLRLFPRALVTSNGCSFSIASTNQVIAIKSEKPEIFRKTSISECRGIVSVLSTWVPLSLLDHMSAKRTTILSLVKHNWLIEPSSTVRQYLHKKSQLRIMSDVALSGSSTGAEIFLFGPSKATSMQNFPISFSGTPCTPTGSWLVLSKICWASFSFCFLQSFLEIKETEAPVSIGHWASIP